MSKQSTKFWWYWLLLVTDGVALFGLALMFLPDLTMRFFNLILFNTTQGSDFFGANGAYITFVYAVLGAVMVGWATTMAFVLLGSFKRGEREGWYAIAVSLVVWFVLDTSFSLYYGFGGNAVLNTVFLVLFAVPLAGTYKQFFSAVDGYSATQPTAEPR